ncbi:biotin--[acetyl-CoA-carboxylase] ligase [Vicingaceae bacterium]|nr:biotin--[acetyl-CoA-carboxylase] ligase [Vicingaceae bacterium]MDB4061774.1 biotin--[acetyl-CoA-carboxylase] ligase [Vicingaceae bacterium]MDC1451782.1 biotin--[acetyl-CoA-carboxylase] ligase [Vicingaceae bacterium]
MDSSEFQFQFIHLNSIHSTNIYAFELLRQKNIVEGTVISTDYQEKGKGQLGQKWESKQGKNLQFSIVISPKLEVDNQFQLSQLVAISLKEWLDTMAVDDVKIKWPNDILVEGKKIAGVLIENSIQGQEISHSVIGIGININQEVFSNFQRPATSLKLELDRSWDRQALLEEFLQVFRSNYVQFTIGQLNVNQLYLDFLHGYGKPLQYKDAEGEFFGVILGVLPLGKLQVNRNGKLKSYDLKELSFLY